MQGIYIFIEKEITTTELQLALKELFPNLTFYEWNLQENIIAGELNKVLSDKDILIDLTYKTGIFKTHVEFYRFPGDESGSRIDLYIGNILSNRFDCKTAIDGYSYCDFDQMPVYSLLLENNHAYLIGDCYPDVNWTENDPRVNDLKIDVLQEIDLSLYKETYNGDGIKISK